MRKRAAGGRPALDTESEGFRNRFHSGGGSGKNERGKQKEVAIVPSRSPEGLKNEGSA